MSVCPIKDELSDIGGKPGTVNDSDLDSVTLQAYKVKQHYGQNLGSDNCIYQMPNICSIYQCLDWLLKKSQREKYNVNLKTPNLPNVFFILVSDLDSGSATVSDLDNNSL